MTSDDHPTPKESPTPAGCLAFSDFRLLAAISEECIAIRPLRETLEAVSAQIARIAGVKRTTITLLDEEHEYLKIVAEYPAGGEHSFVGRTIRLAGRSVQRNLVEQNAVVNAFPLQDHPIVRESPGFASFASNLGIQSLLIVPIEYDGRVIGSIGLDSSSARTFTEAEIQASRAIANLAGLAIQNAKFFEQSRTCHVKVQELIRAPDERRATRTVNEVAQQIFDSIQSVAPFKKASLQWIDGNRRTLLSARGFDLRSVDPDLQLPLHADRLVHRLVTEQVPIVLADTNKSDDWIARPGTDDVNSWIGLPILQNSRTIAFVTLDHDKPGFYERHDAIIEELQEVIHRATETLQQAYQYDVAQRQIEALRIANEVGLRISTKLDATQILEVVASAIAEGPIFGQCRIFVVQTTDPKVRLVCTAADPPFRGSPQTIDIPHTETSAPNPLEYVYRSGVPLRIDDIRSDERFSAASGLDVPFRSIIVSPLLAGDRVLGVVAVTAKTPCSFSKIDAALVETLAADAGTAIDRAKGLELLHDIGNRVIQAHEVETVLREIVRGAMDLTQKESGIIYILDEDGNAVSKEYTPDKENHPHPRLDDPTGVTRRVIDSKSELVIEDIRDDENVNPRLLDHFRSMIAVPLMVESKVVGVLYLNGQQPGGVTEVQLSLLLTLASQGAVATEQARLNQTIEDSEANYRSLVDNIPQFLFRKDVDGHFEFANRRFCQSHQQTLEQLIGKTDFDLYERDLAREFRRRDQEVIHNRKTAEWEEENRTLCSETSMWVKVLKTPVLNARDEVIGVQAIFWDITEEKRTDRRYRSLVDQSPDGIVVYRDRIILLANPAAVRLFGAKSEDQVVGKSILDFVDDSDRELAETRMRAFDNERDVPESIEMKLRPKKDHSNPIYVELHSRPTAFLNERQVVFHDLTMVREMHHRVRRALNQIATSLVQQQQYSRSPEISEVFAKIQGRIQAMALLHTFLTKVKGTPLVDMDAYFDELIEKIVLARDIDTDEIKVVTVKGGVQLTEGVAMRCGLIVNELATNAIVHAFDAGGGTIKISLTETTVDEYNLFVSDDGRGMSTAEIRVDSMGLSLVHGFVEDGLKGTYTISGPPGTRVDIHFEQPKGS